MNSDEHRWIDEDAGPVARLYTVTSGRTRPDGERYFDLVDIVVCTGKALFLGSLPGGHGPEHGRIVELCQVPVAVAELASVAGLPLGVVRVLLGDLVRGGLVEVRATTRRGRITDRQLLRHVLEGLQALLTAGPGRIHLAREMK